MIGQYDISKNVETPIPRYFRVFEALRSEIQAGRYNYGEALPTEAALCERFSMSRATIRTALSLLEREGLVEKEQGRGTFCRYEPSDRGEKSSLEGLVENLIAMGLQTDVSVLASEFVSPGPELSGALAVDRDDQVHRSVRVRSHKGVPFSYLVTHIPSFVARDIDIQSLSARPLLVLLEESGLIVSEAEQWISATLATAAQAQSLNVDIGSPLISLTRVVYDDRKRPVEHLQAYYRPDQYSFSLSLERGRGAEAAMWKARL